MKGFCHDLPSFLRIIRRLVSAVESIPVPGDFEASGPEPPQPDLSPPGVLLGGVEVSGNALQWVLIFDPETGEDVPCIQVAPLSPQSLASLVAFPLADGSGYFDDAHAWEDTVVFQSWQLGYQERLAHWLGELAALEAWIEENPPSGSGVDAEPTNTAIAEAKRLASLLKKQWEYYWRLWTR